MQTIYRASRYLLPAAFGLYAVVANVAFFTQPDVPDVPLAWSSLQGKPTAELDGIYKKALPHREASIGLLGAARYLAVGEGRKGVLAAQDGWLFTVEETRRLDAADLTAAVGHIAEIHDMLATQGVQLVMVPVPAKIDVYRAEAGHMDLSDAMAQDYAGFMAQLRGAGVDVVDTRPALLAITGDDPAFFRTDTHWTRAGADAVAQAVAASGEVAAGDATYTAVADVPKSFTGDLVSYVTTDAIAPAIGLAAEDVTPMHAAADAAVGDLFGGAAADVVLVGTSYSANADWSFAEALKISLGRDVLNYAEQGQGPARPMLAYMASDDLKQTPPKVVIWEFPVRYLSDPQIWDAPAVTVASNGT
jgi:alginate O-acetyltransferase complex protein AlgJ